MPKKTKESAFVKKLWFHIERRFGTQITSFLIKDLQISPKTKIDVVRFQQYYPFKTTTDPFIDLFVNPKTMDVQINVWDSGASYTKILNPYDNIEDMEFFFASLILGAGKDEQGNLEVPATQYYMQ